MTGMSPAALRLELAQHEEEHAEQAEDRRGGAGARRVRARTRTPRRCRRGRRRGRRRRTGPGRASPPAGGRGSTASTCSRQVEQAVVHEHRGEQPVVLAVGDAVRGSARVGRCRRSAADLAEHGQRARISGVLPPNRPPTPPPNSALPALWPDSTEAISTATLIDDQADRDVAVRAGARCRRRPYAPGAGSCGPRRRTPGTGDRPTPEFMQSGQIGRSQRVHRT